MNANHINKLPHIAIWDTQVHELVTRPALKHTVITTYCTKNMEVKIRFYVRRMWKNKKIKYRYRIYKIS